MQKKVTDVNVMGGVSDSVSSLVKYEKHENSMTQVSCVKEQPVSRIYARFRLITL